jgi:hypothetical protein
MSSPLKATILSCFAVPTSTSGPEVPVMLVAAKPARAAGGVHNTIAAATVKMLQTAH